MKRFYLPALVAIGLILAWEALRRGLELPPVVLPSPWAVLASVLTIPELSRHIALTSAEAVTGFVAGNALALVAAVAILKWPNLERAIVPYGIALKTTPIAALVPLLILWLGAGFLSKAVAAAAVCFAPLFVNGIRGLRAVDADYLDLFQAWGAGWWRTLLYLRLPFALPYFFAALKLSASLALVGAVVAELVAGDGGLGFLIVVFSRHLDTPQMFATLAVCTFLGLVALSSIVVVERFLGRRYRHLVSESELV